MKPLAGTLSLLLALALISPGAALAEPYQNGVYEDAAEGYNEPIHVRLTVKDGKIDEVAAYMGSGAALNEYTQKAIDAIAPAVKAKGGVDGVDTVSGATGSSQTILKALEGALEQARVGPPEASGAQTGGADASGGKSASGGLAPTVSPDTAERFLGLGSAVNFRVGPGKDADGGQVYSLNVAMATAVFDREGRIVDVTVDVYEIATPNYDGESMPHFSGWPGAKAGPTVRHPEGTLADGGDVTEETAAAELSAWATKRERGDAYGMNPANEWYRQMDAYQRWMRGQTVRELRAWFERSTTAAGRPIKADSANEDDQAKLAALTEEQRAALADVVSMATMSLSDSHGLMLEAVEKAYKSRRAIE